MSDETQEMEKDPRGEFDEMSPLPPEAPEYEMTAKEFCIDRSRTDRRVEVLSGFHHWVQNVEKVLKAPKAVFEALLEKFQRRQV